jgi:hypothetical protein
MAKGWNKFSAQDWNGYTAGQWYGFTPDGGYDPNTWQIVASEVSVPSMTTSVFSTVAAIHTYAPDARTGVFDPSKAPTVVYTMTRAQQAS